ncbi:MAG TPA: polysaccharide deacetylase [Cyanobacteria bacterium UBA11369]|nr:polysaccharide deacetylase [Cyanobacteria bacterium UBA11371]HBE32778.1 polysaccharide deacetylase [Cyanobacteria bacterium UBA11368]HBE48918.1 polysaccharide deacetylase [Cyanobacteria bacterium UBA11369]
MKFIKFKKSKSFILGFCLTFIVVLATNWLILNLTAPRIPILGFHSIIDNPPPNNNAGTKQPLDSDYTKQDLQQFLDYLVRQDFWFLSTQDLYDYFIAKSKPLPPERIGQRPIMISFDDSYKTYYTNLLPILELLEQTYNKKVKVVLFLNPGLLAKDQTKSTTHLNCGDLREGFRKGFFDLQSHGQTHKDLTKLNPQDLDFELSESKKQLIECTEGLDNKTVGIHLAYPYGHVNKQVEAAVAKYYLSGYLYNSRMFKLGWLRSQYQIPRLTVNRERTPEKLIKMAERALKVTVKN